MLHDHPSTASASTDQELIAAVERELRQIGDELHDNLCQTLAGTSMVMETIGRAVAARKPVSPHALKNLRNILEAAIAQTRSLSHRFNPAKLAGVGLMSAFQRLSEDSPNCQFTCEKPVIVNDPEIALALLRIAQEAVKNSVQHSGARKIRLTLKQTAREVVLRIKDNGCGFAVPKSNGHITGLRMMERRAEAVGGRLRALSRSDSGTVITCNIPITPSTRSSR